MNHIYGKPLPGAGADDDLRQTLQNALRQSQPQADSEGLAALQGRVLSQWEQRTAASVSAGSGPVAALRRTLATRPVRMGMASLAVIVAVVIQTSWTRSDPALDDLMEPDVLSLITLGEL